MFKLRLLTKLNLQINPRGWQPLTPAIIKKYKPDLTKIKVDETTQVLCYKIEEPLKKTAKKRKKTTKIKEI